MRSKIMEAFLDPRGALTYLMRTWTIKHVSGSGFREIHEYYSDLRSNTSLRRYIRERIEQAKGPITRASELYVLIRALSPNVVVETGVSSGVSSTFILQGLKDNQRGTLYSIDEPNADPSAALPEGLSSGWLIPHWLRDRWKLSLGRSSELLPPLLAKLKMMDLFLHDSEHSYENMMFEFKTAWKFLRDGGLLLSHDVFWNSAFSDFSRSLRRRPSYIVDIGLLRK